MKRTVLYLIIYIGVCLSGLARDLTFHGESLATALATLRSIHTDYTINFIANDLDQLPVHAKLNGLSLPDAVKRLCEGQPVKAKIRGKQIFVQYDKNYKPRTIKLKGSVRDNQTHDYLVGAKVELLDEDSTVIDTTTAKYRSIYYDTSGQEVENYTGWYTFEVPAFPRNYIFRVSYDDYHPVCYSYVMDRVGRRETSRTVSPFYLHKMSKTLQEVTISASRVRFYYKGDTIVFNADQLQLADGSMLDALLQQLSGVELKNDGRIYHNGKFVDDLLLNGKDFFRGNRQLMLKNLPAYTVKDVAVYNKQTEENEWLGRKDESTQHYVLDVRLKKEYMTGWMANLEVGTGLRQDEMPYLARLFAMRHGENSQISIIAKANNLNDGDTYMSGDSQWAPSSSNSLRHDELASIIVNVDPSDKKWRYYSTYDVKHSTERQEKHTVAQTFLPSGDTYDYAFGQAKDEDWRGETYHVFTYESEQLRLQNYAVADYHRFHNTSSSTSGLFSAPVAEVSHQLLDDLFSSTSSRPNLRDTLVNRQLREGYGTGHDVETYARVLGTLKVKGSNDYLNFIAYGSYSENARQQFSRQATHYAGSQQAPLFRHQFTDTPPRSKFSLMGNVTYTFVFGEHYRQLHLGYTFTHNNSREQESIYRLDRLPGADSSFARPVDLLPSVMACQQVFDRRNSFLSHHIDNNNYIWADFKYGLGQKEWGQFYLDFSLAGTLKAQRNDYERGAIDTLLNRLSPTFEFKTKPWLRTKDGHHAGLEIRVRNEAPDLLNDAAIVDDTDPMNIRIGNPDLRNALRTEATLDGNFYSMNKRMHNRLDFSYGFTQNAIGMGQTYDRETGIRTYRPTNVNGNWNAAARHTINYSFGDGKKHSAQMVTQYGYQNSVDLLGDDDMLASSESVVRTATLSFAPKLNLSLGKHSLSFTSDVAWNRYTGGRTTFQNISAWQYRVGADATIRLPWKFDFTTNLTLYGRTGYADASLNTNDVVWNARLSRPLFNGKWLIALDGFDILGQLSNVTRTINAQGRTETYTNVTPRYGLLHVVYRFNKQPKRK